MPGSGLLLGFALGNAGLGLGFVRLVLGLQRPFWSTEPRSDGPIQAKTSTGLSESPSAPAAPGSATAARRNAA